MEAMDLLNENGCLFGASVTYHRNNIEDVSSEEFIDLLIDKESGSSGISLTCL